MAKTGQQKPNAQFTAAESKEKHELSLRQSESLRERDQSSRLALQVAKTNAEAIYKANPTKNNYRKMQTAANRTV